MQASPLLLQTHFATWDPLTIQYLNSCAPLRGTQNEQWVVGKALTSLANTKWKWQWWVLHAVIVLKKNGTDSNVTQRKLKSSVCTVLHEDRQQEKKNEWNDEYSRTNSWSHECRSSHVPHG
jgi:hypothetical protein